MQVNVSAEQHDLKRRGEQVLHYFIPVLDGAVERLDVDISSPPDPLGSPLYCCRVSVRPAHGKVLELEETQADLVLAMTRLFDRTVRTLKRRQVARQMA